MFAKIKGGEGGVPVMGVWVNIWPCIYGNSHVGFGGLGLWVLGFWILSSVSVCRVLFWALGSIGRMGFAGV